MKNKILVLGSIFVMLLLFGLGSQLVQKKEIEKHVKHVEDRSESLVRDYSITLGPSDAKVTLVEFFDPACETCSDFYPLVKQILKDHPQKIKLVMRYAPFHKGADYYVKILEAARKQNLYWEVLEILYGTQNYWASHHVAKPELAWEVLKNVGMDLAKLKEDMKNPSIEFILRNDIEDAAKLHVSKTPSFFVNGKPLVRFGYSQLRDLIASELNLMY
jgi:protein-disulfide isomerase